MKANFFRIRGNDSIKNVQERFSSLFPSMQMSFFRDPNISEKTPDQCVLFSTDMQMNAITPMPSDLIIEITSDMRVNELEKIMKSSGLHAQISCRIVNRKLPETSVSKWMLKDVYRVDEPHISMAADINSLSAKRWNSIYI